MKHILLFALSIISFCSAWAQEVKTGDDYVRIIKRHYSNCAEHILMQESLFGGNPKHFSLSIAFATCDLDTQQEAQMMFLLLQEHYELIAEVSDRASILSKSNDEGTVCEVIAYDWHSNVFFQTKNVFYQTDIENIVKRFAPNLDTLKNY